MSLRALQPHLKSSNVIDYVGSEAARGTALAFVFNDDFLDSFRVLAYSLLRTGSFVDSPIYIFSEQKAVLEDRLVRLIADKAVWLSDDMIAQFQNISRERINAKSQLEWIPKYTFLKWNIFDDVEAERLLFIDADVIALTCVETILDAAGDADLAYAPSMKVNIHLDEQERPRPYADVLRNVGGMIEGTGEMFDTHSRVNSGVLLLGKKLLSKEIRNELVEFAQRNSYVNEQSYITGFFTTNPARFRVKLIGSRYNFAAGQLERLSVIDQIPLLSKIALLHYPGGSKPWRRVFRENSRFTHMVWRKVRADAETTSRLFRRKRASAPAVRQVEIDSLKATLKSYPTIRRAAKAWKKLKRRLARPPKPRK